jgi:hypothetical protein
LFGKIWSINLKSHYFDRKWQFTRDVVDMHAEGGGDGTAIGFGPAGLPDAGQQLFEEGCGAAGGALVLRRLVQLRLGAESHLRALGLLRARPTGPRHHGRNNAQQQRSRASRVVRRRWTLPVPHVRVVVRLVSLRHPIVFLQKYEFNDVETSLIYLYTQNTSYIYKYLSFCFIIWSPSLILFSWAKSLLVLIYTPRHLKYLAKMVYN